MHQMFLKKLPRWQILSAALAESPREVMENIH